MTAWKLLKEQPLDFVLVIYYSEEGKDMSNLIYPYRAWRRVKITEIGGTNYIKEAWVSEGSFRIIYGALWSRHYCSSPPTIQILFHESIHFHPQHYPFRPSASGSTTIQGEVWINGSGYYPDFFSIKVFWEINWRCIPGSNCPNRDSYWLVHFTLEEY